jgi:hypothetical protein
MVTTNHGVVFESRIGPMMRGISITLATVDERQQRIAGMSASVAVVALGAVLALVTGTNPEGPIRRISIGAGSSISPTAASNSATA